MQEEFYNLLAESKARGCAIFMSSHILSEVQRTCDRVGIIRDGKLIEERVIADMAKEASQTFDITFSGKVPLSELKKISHTKVTNVKKDSLTIHMHGKLAPLFSVLAKHDVTMIDARNLDLEDMFLGFYKDKKDSKNE
jgi:ABC-2 type transport system ATP-binding protein